ncbi:hypothetical protein HS088_TW05G00058 [Tripterygium wilfordii]|uniref:Uncharacterized protein n=1 Tax=Tripterygium wilfordii TaxID=458696 RepID=A0A7J7DLX4_TRIWF|nr:hypothetical protein HS088_TW05G00058 [Tripterygium wilfordii]
MGCSKPERTCKNHPDLKQLQGVCASCLREKLTDLNLPLQMNKREPSRSSSFSVSISSPSKHGNYHRHKRVGSDIIGSMRCIASVGDGLKKSKSITFVPTNRVGGEDKKKGFWSKLLLHSKGSKKEVLMHSKTARARLY